MVIKSHLWLSRLPNLVLTIPLRLRTKCVEILDHQPDIVNPLSVSIQPSGKKRLILDLRHVNSYVFKRKFRCEDISVALQIFAKGFLSLGTIT